MKTWRDYCRNDEHPDYYSGPNEEYDTEVEEFYRQKMRKEKIKLKAACTTDAGKLKLAITELLDGI